MNLKQCIFVTAIGLATFGCQQSSTQGQVGDPVVSTFSGSPTDQLNGSWYGLGKIRHNNTVQQNLKYDIKVNGLPKNVKIDLQIFDPSTNSTVTTFRYLYGSVIGNIIYDSRTNEKVGMIGAQGLKLEKRSIGFIQIDQIDGYTNKSHVIGEGLFGGTEIFKYDSDLERY